MDAEPRILWTEGLFLAPQHLQQQDRHHAAAISALWLNLAPHRWGVARFELDEDALARGLVRPKAFEAVTAEGVFLQAAIGAGSGGNARLRPLAVPAGSVIGPARLYAAIARETPDRPSIATPGEAEQGERVPRRYEEVVGEFRDIYDARVTDRADVARLLYLVQFAVIPEGPAGEAQRAALFSAFDALPLARLLPRTEGFQLDPIFVPPALSIGAVPRLRDRIAELGERMISKIADIEPEVGMRRLKAEVGLPQNLGILIVLRSLHEHASAVVQAAETAGTTVEETYFRLRQAVADLAAFSPSVSVLGEIAAEDDRQAKPPLPAYVHEDMGWRIQRAMDILQLLMQGLGRGAQISVELTFEPPSSWAADIKPEFFGGPVTRYFLLVESRMPPSEVEARLAARKIGAPEDMRNLIERNLFGVQTTRLADPPPGLPARAGRYTYFEVEARDSYWERIQRARHICIFCPEMVGQDVRIRLFREASA